MSENKQWAYSFDEENYQGRFDTKESCIQEAEREYDEDEHEGIWIGEVNSRTAREMMPSAYWIIEHMQNCAYDLGGEHAEDYLDGITKEKAKELDSDFEDALYAVFEKHGIKIEPTFYGILRPVPHKEKHEGTK